MVVRWETACPNSLKSIIVHSFEGLLKYENLKLELELPLEKQEEALSNEGKCWREKSGLVDFICL